jgi:hypothetical protein
MKQEEGKMQKQFSAFGAYGIRDLRFQSAFYLSK